MSVVTRALGIPIDSVGAASEQAPPFGTEKMPNALRTAGLLDRLSLVDDGDADVRLVGPHRHPTSGLTAWPSLDAATRTSRKAISELVRGGERPLVLGGCCALVPGAVAGLRDAVGTAAVVNVDGHLDLYDATTSPTGEAADVPMAALLDLGVPALRDALAPGPVLTPEHIALVGFRDYAEAAANGSAMPVDVGISTTWDVDAVRANPTHVSRGVMAHLRATRFWVHLDLDVLSDDVMPATDYLMPGGLNWLQLSTLLHPLVRNPGFAGLSVACLTPDKDPDGTATSAVTELLVDVLQ